MPPLRGSFPQDPDEPPPLLGTWRRVYIFVLVYLAAVIAVLAAATRFFS